MFRKANIYVYTNDHIMTPYNSHIIAPRNLESAKVQMDSWDVATMLSNIVADKIFCFRILFYKQIRKRLSIFYLNIEVPFCINMNGV